jgi:DNA-binding beta-propeller fold protein YncE
VGLRHETPRIALRYWLAPAAGLAAALAFAFAAAATASAAPLLQPKLIVWGYSEDATFNQPRGIAFDPSDGAIYVANTGEHRIEVFSPTGRAIARFMHRVERPDGSVVDGEPVALAFTRDGRLLVADNMALYVDVLDRRGRQIRRLPVETGRPFALAVARDGSIYVGTTSEASKVYRFNPDFSPAGSWGEQGEGSGQLRSVSALAELPDGNIAVACARTQIGIQIFTPDGAYVRGFTSHDLDSGNVSLPSGLMGTPDGRIWVLDEIRQIIQVYDRDGNYIEATGGKGWGPGYFLAPSSLAADGKGLIAVTDRMSGRFQVLSIRKTGEVSAGERKP